MQANRLLAMWIYRNEWFNEESSRVLIRRGFLSIDRPLLMAQPWIMVTFDLAQAEKPHLPFVKVGERSSNRYYDPILAILGLQATGTPIFKP